MKKIIKLGLVIVWCCVIFLFSNEDSISSNSRSKNIISSTVSVYEKIHNQPVKKREHIVNSWNKWIRKGAHFSIYFILGVLVFWSLGDFIENFSKRILFSLLFCLCYAVFDEIHQIFMFGRTGRLFDVLIDFLGTASAVFIFSLLIKWKQFKLEQK